MKKRKIEIENMPPLIQNKKIRTNITLNDDIFYKAKKYNIILSSFLEIKLREYIAIIEENSVRSISIISDTH